MQLPALEHYEGGLRRSAPFAHVFLPSLLFRTPASPLESIYKWFCKCQKLPALCSGAGGV